MQRYGIDFISLMYCTAEYSASAFMPTLEFGKHGLSHMTTWDYIEHLSYNLDSACALQTTMPFERTVIPF